MTQIKNLHLITQFVYGQGQFDINNNEDETMTSEFTPRVHWILVVDNAIRYTTGETNEIILYFC